MTSFSNIGAACQLALLEIQADGSELEIQAADDKTYTKPDLRERLKNRIMAGDKGGASGQWSARKAQMLALAYKSAGGGYSGGQRTAQKSLKTWGKQKWTTLDGKPAIRTDNSGSTVTARYLPEAKWRSITPGQAAATDRKKREGSKDRQFVANTKSV
jgi:hypothetical protein